LIVHFNGKVTIRNSVFIYKFLFTDGGQNKDDMLIENNVFNCSADFFDEYFTAKFILKNNVFISEQIYWHTKNSPTM